MIAPSKFIPYRLRTYLHQRQIKKALRDITNTRVMECADPSVADAEVHMLLCHRDLLPGAVALKSLLRFEQIRLAVTVTDDGSLSSSDRRWFDNQFSGLNWLNRRSDAPELEALLQGRPFLRSLYQSSFQLVCKLVHPLALSRVDRVIILDADTVFFGQPQTLVDWATSGSHDAWYLHDIWEKESTVPQYVRQAFAEFASSLPEHQANWKLDYYFFNSGFLLYNVRQCNVDVAEAFLEWREHTEWKKANGLETIWFGNWTLEQTAYLSMFALMNPHAKPLGDEYHLGFDPNRSFNHFMRANMVKPATLKRLEAVIGEL